MDAQTTLFDHYADIPALQAEKAEVLKIFAEIREGITNLSNAGFKLDTAKTVSQMKAAVNDITKLQDQLMQKNREVELFEQKMTTLRQKNQEMLLKIQKLEEDISLRKAQTAKADAQTDAARTDSLIKQEKELERLIALEEKRKQTAAQTTPETVQSTGIGLTAAERASEEDSARTQVPNEEPGAPVFAFTNEEANRQLQEGSKAASEQAAQVQLLAGAYDEYTGSLKTNLVAQTDNQVALVLNQEKQRALNAEIKSTGIATDEQKAQLAALNEEEALLKSQATQLNQIIGLQVKELNAEAGSADELRARLSLLRITYEGLGVAEKNATSGQFLKNEINTLAPALDKLDQQSLRGRQGLKNLESAFESAGSRLSSFIVRDIFRGIAGLLVFTLAVEGVTYVFQKLVEWINQTSDAEKLAAEKLEAMNKLYADSNKEAAKEIDDLKFLRQATEDVTLPMATRLKAIQGLKQEFPEYYKQLNDEIILLGKDTDAYNAATEALLKNARAKAAKNQVDDLEAQRLNHAFEMQKITNASKNEIGNAKDIVETDVIAGGYGTTTSVSTKQDQIVAILKRRDEALDEHGKKINEIIDKEKFLAQFIDNKSIVDVITNQQHIKAPQGETDENYFKLLEQAQKSAQAYKDFLSKEAQEELKIIEENEAINTNVRIKARQQRSKLEIADLEEEENSKLQEIDAQANKEKSKRKITQDEINLIDQDAQNKRLLVQAEYSKKIGLATANESIDIIKIQKSGHDKEISDYKAYIAEIERLDEDRVKKRTDFLLKNFKESTAFNNQNYDVGASQAISAYNSKNKGLNPKDDGDKISNNYEQLQEQLSQLDSERQSKNLKAEIDYYRQLVDVDKEGSTQQIEDKTKFLDAQEKLDKLDLERQKKNVDFVKKYQDELNDAYKKLGREVESAAKDVLDASYDRQITKLQTQIDLVDQLKDAEINRINESTDSEAVKADKIAIINAKAQADKEALQRRENQINRDKAKFDKSYKAFEIGLDEIKTLNALKLQLAEVTAKAAVNPAYAAAIPLVAAQIPISIAVSAAELVAVLAQPLPAYFKGTQSSGAGFATVAEFGPELAKEPSGKLTLYNTPTLANLVGGTRIFTADETQRIMALNESERMKMLYGFHNPVIKTDDRQVKELEKLNKKDWKAAIHIHNHAPIETTTYYHKNFKS